MCCVRACVQGTANGNIERPRASVAKEIDIRAVASYEFEASNEVIVEVVRPLRLRFRLEVYRLRKNSDSKGRPGLSRPTPASTRSTFHRSEPRAAKAAERVLRNP